MARHLTHAPLEQQTSHGKGTGGAGPSQSHPATWGPQEPVPAPAVGQQKLPYDLGVLIISVTQCHMPPHPGRTSNLPGFCSRSSLLLDRYCQALALREEGIPFRQRSFTYSRIAGRGTASGTGPASKFSPAVLKFPGTPLPHP